MAKFLVTGGAGFIGSHLVRYLLSQHHQVRVLDNLSTGCADRIPHQCELQIGDIRVPADVSQAMRDVDGCFHLAAIASVQQSNTQWLGTHQINLGGTINLFEAARLRSTPVVYASSAAVYGDNADVPLSEASLARPLTAYGADKLGSEQHARVAGLVHGVPTRGLRFFNVFGPMQDPQSPYSGVISIFVDRLMRGQPVTIYGDGEQSRDFVYVADVVTALCSAMQNVDPHGGAFNVCTGESISINQLARVVMSILGTQLPIQRKQTRQGDIRVSIGDPSRARKELGFSSSWSLVDGLRELIAYEQARQGGGSALRAEAG